jgi:hypothetical protein
MLLLYTSPRQCQEEEGGCVQVVSSEDSRKEALTHVHVGRRGGASHGDRGSEKQNETKRRSSDEPELETTNEGALKEVTGHFFSSLMLTM